MRGRNLHLPIDFLTRLPCRVFFLGAVGVGSTAANNFLEVETHVTCTVVRAHDVIEIRKFFVPRLALDSLCHIR